MGLAWADADGSWAGKLSALAARMANEQLEQLLIIWYYIWTARNNIWQSKSLPTCKGKSCNKLPICTTLSKKPINLRGQYPCTRVSRRRITRTMVLSWLIFFGTLLDFESLIVIALVDMVTRFLIV